MNFEDLHECLRLELAGRIERGELTGTALARAAGFQQAHVSNFLNRKRALSMHGLDRVLAALGLTVEQMLPLELSAAETVPDGVAAETVPVVTASAAMDEAVVEPGSVMEMVAAPAGRLKENRALPAAGRAGWQRLVAVRVDAGQAAAMEPVLPVGSVAVIDRHYCSAAPYRAQQRSVFAVKTGSGLALRYVDFDAGILILRPLAVNFPVELVAVGVGESAADSIVGRVCLVMADI